MLAARMTGNLLPIIHVAVAIRFRFITAFMVYMTTQNRVVLADTATHRSRSHIIR